MAGALVIFELCLLPSDLAMSAPNFNFDAQMVMTGGITATPSARTILNDRSGSSDSDLGPVKFWAKGPTATPVIRADSPLGLTPGALESAATVHSIGLEWNITGDTNHDAQGTVQYRAQGMTTWKSALPLIRVDYLGANTLAGSILFLTPGTTYEVKVDISDPDGGAASQTLTIATRLEPSLPTGGRTLHAIPGSSGGDGSAGNPYRGFAAAWTNARAGDIVLVHAGSYGTVSASGKPSGAANNHIVFQAAGDGPAIIEWIDLRYVSYIWFYGLTFNSHNAPMPSGALDADDYTAVFASLLNAGYDTDYQSMSSDVNGIMITRCNFNGYKHAIRGGRRVNGWFIADNTIVGNRTLGMTSTPSFDGEGIELGGGSDHIVAYNSITLTADAISAGATNSGSVANLDIYGNDIFNVTDDGIELDGAGANTRVWENRIHNAGHNGFSFQPQGGAPWYLIRNQVVNVQESIFKFRDADRFVALHNTFVSWDWVLDHWSDQVLRGITKNNLWIAVNNGPIWKRGGATVDWRTQLDYDGFDWGTSGYAFSYAGSDLTSLSSLTAATNQEIHGIRINRATCFENFNVPGAPPLTTIPPQWMTLQPSCPAVDAGVMLPNINDGYTGVAPDLGAYERGKSLPQYGPRPLTSTPDTTAPSVPTGLRIR